MSGRRRRARGQREELRQYFQALDSALANIQYIGILFDCKKEEFSGRVEDALGTLKIIIEWCNLQNDQTLSQTTGKMEWTFSSVAKTYG